MFLIQAMTDYLENGLEEDDENNPNYEYIQGNLTHDIVRHFQLS